MRILTFDSLNVNLFLQNPLLFAPFIYVHYFIYLIYSKICVYTLQSYDKIKSYKNIIATYVLKTHFLFQKHLHDTNTFVLRQEQQFVSFLFINRSLFCAK